MLVLDTSTLVLLAKSDLLPLLAQRTRLVIPEEVVRDALAKPQLYDAQVIARLLSTGKMHAVKRAHGSHRKRIEADFTLGPGEAAALLLAKENACPIGTDDGPAIKAAKIAGVPFVTAVHVLMGLYENGRIDREVALAKLDRLQHVGRYNVHILDDALARIQKAR